MKKLSNLLLAAFAATIISACGHSEPELFPVMMGSKWGFVNANGDYVVNPIMDEADYFMCGLARVIYQGKVGYIKPNGKFHIQAEYVQGSSFCEDKAFVTKSGEAPSCINTSGKVLFCLDRAEYAFTFSNGMARFQTDDYKFGFVNDKGSIVIEPVYEDAFDFCDGLARVLINGKWGYIDKTGTIVITPEYEECQDFSEGFAGVKVGNQWGYIIKDGSIAINPQFSIAKEFREGVAKVTVGGNDGFINTKGKFIINPQFENASSFANGLASITTFKSPSEMGYGYINKSGKIVINPQFANASEFSGKYAFACDLMTGKVGIINKRGEYVVKPQFDKAKEPCIFTFNVRSNSYDATDVLSSFFNEHGDTADMGLTEESTLGDVKEMAPIFKGPSDSTVTCHFVNPEAIKGVSVTHIDYGFNQKAYKLVDNYVYTWLFGTVKNGQKREYISTCLLKTAEFHFNLEDIAEGKEASFTKSMTAELEKRINDEFTYSNGIYTCPLTNTHHGYMVSNTTDGVVLRVTFAK